MGTKQTVGFDWNVALRPSHKWVYLQFYPYQLPPTSLLCQPKLMGYEVYYLIFLCSGERESFMGDYLEQPLFDVRTRVETQLAPLLVQGHRFVFYAYPPLYIPHLPLIFFYFAVVDCQSEPVTLRALPTPTCFSQDRHPSRVRQLYLVSHFSLYCFSNFLF